MRWGRSETQVQHVRASERTLDKLDVQAAELQHLLAELRETIEAERDDD